MCPAFLPLATLPCRCTLLALLMALLGTSLQPARSETFDVLIRGGRVVDGTGAPWYHADIGLRDGKIAQIGKLEEADGGIELDADGLVVAPGLIDMMGQSATPMLDDPKTAINLLTQGITTINAGEGGSAAPLTAEQGDRRGWTTMAEYFALLELKGMPVNVAQSVGHTQVRRVVMGEQSRRPSDAELAAMQSLVDESMRAGAIGVSTALIYPPAVYAQTKEISALASVAGRHGGKYFTHMRNEGDRLLEAIDEALAIGRQGNSPVHIFHLKAAGQQNWGKMPLAIASIAAARAKGESVTADIYPYVNNGLGIAAMIHPDHFADGYDRLRSRLDDPKLRATIRKEMETTTGWENWFRHVNHDWDRVVIGQAEDPAYKDVLGLSIAEIAEVKGDDPWDIFFTLAKQGAFVLPQSMTEANKIRAMQAPFVSFCTDVGPAGGDRSASHPRAFGSFPRLLSHYVRDLGAISLERAIAQASAAAANVLMAHDRGRIAEGLAADLILFDFSKLKDRADFREPTAASEGMRHVIVNGVVVLRDGTFTGARPGRVLRGPGFAAPQPSAGSDNLMEPFDRVVREVLTKHRIPGASVAVTDQGRLVHRQAYGTADLATGEPVTSDSLFRIASISKPITAVAVLTLVESNRLHLDDRVFELLDFETEIEAAGDQFDQRLRDITVRHLLQHRGGWDRNRSFDAMFRSRAFAEKLGVPAPADPQSVIRAMLTQELDFAPGARYAYSNFGYCLLGRIIEKVSGEGYESFVQSHVLQPIGINTMRLGKTRLSGRVENEVRYYHPGRGPSVFDEDLGEPVPSAYGAWYLEAMDAHGAWIASATDLAKFACAFDSVDDCPILSPESIELMHQRPQEGKGTADEIEPTFYSLGWSNRHLGNGKFNRWHSGSLPGTATILIRRHDGKNLVALLNARESPARESVGKAIDQMLHRAAAAVDDGPTRDLFSDDENDPNDIK